MRTFLYKVVRILRFTSRVTRWEQHPLTVFRMMPRPCREVPRSTGAAPQGRQ